MSDQDEGLPLSLEQSLLSTPTSTVSSQSSATTPSPWRHVREASISSFEKRKRLLHHQMDDEKKEDGCCDKTTTTVTTATASSAHERKPEGYTALNEEEEEDEHDTSLPIPFSRRPLHYSYDPPLRYYRVVYRGVVALLSSPERNAPRSGSYLSYGEVFASAYELEVDRVISTSLSPQRTTTQATVPSLPLLPSSLDNDTLRVIRVDQVLTGGYAADTNEKNGAHNCNKRPSPQETPRRSNSHYVPLHDLDGYGGQENDRSLDSTLGYIFSNQQDVLIVEPIPQKPLAETGRFLYKITCTTPIPILTGPSMDAPKTKAMILPGTTHEVSLRVTFDADSEDAVTFLRLSHRRGWIADRKLSKRRDKDENKYVPVVREVTMESHHPLLETAGADDGTASIVSSIAVSSVSAPSTVTRRRHRPPRRKEAVQDAILPRQIVGTNSVKTTNISRQSKDTNESVAGSEKQATPLSNMSLLSDDESLEHNTTTRYGTHPSSPDLSHATSTARSNVTMPPPRQPSKFYLMRVTAPRGLKILDAPQFQVNNLIHGKHALGANVSSSHMVSEMEATISPKKSHQSIFQTMSGRLTTTGPSKTGNPAVFDSSSKTRILPRGVLFEASRRMESTGAYNQGDGLIKLSDGSGWAIVPRRDELELQYRSYSNTKTDGSEASLAFEEVGNAILSDTTTEVSESEQCIWVRIACRNGVPVACPPPSAPTFPKGNSDVSPTSRASSSLAGSNPGSNFGPLTSHDSDVASSVGSAFLDAMFRTPRKNKKAPERDAQALKPPASFDSEPLSNILPCGMTVQIERSLGSTMEYARLRGGQGWIPLEAGGKPVVQRVSQPELRFGSFWFRVQSSRGIKVRLGPSRKAPSIKSDDGVYFRFECGEFLRASEILTVFSKEGEPVECFAKLYRNRHARLHENQEKCRQLQSLTMQAEWVQVYNESELFLEECAEEPRIERHKQGWRYNIVPDSGVAVRRGPSFAAEKTGVILFGGESIVINEKVSPAGDKISWLRMKDGQGWIHDVTDTGEQILVPHSLRHRSNVEKRPQKGPAKKEDIAYNTIIARLFHNESPGSNAYVPAKNLKAELH